MKLKYKGAITLTSKGYTFNVNDDSEHNVADDVGRYLLKTFKESFTLVEEEKIEEPTPIKTPNKRRGKAKTDKES